MALEIYSGSSCLSNTRVRRFKWQASTSNCAARPEVLKDYGHIRLFLDCSPDPKDRSYGFYRHLGWQSTGALDTHGDEILEFACR